ncbi:hypothetical protein PENSPDRAFT_683239 [Peniophora sp. CONT]|nr:hypothetical protein PENSPDRAFT_683239 [Peniophora sp. CONT]
MSSTIQRAGVRALRNARPMTRAASTSNTLNSPATTSTATPDDADPQLAGYPQLPNVSRQTLPARGWWDMQMRRNMGDTLHEREELYSMWGPDIPNVDPKTALRHFTIVASGFVTFAFMCKYLLTPEMPAIRREYPFDGLVKELGGLEENKQRVESQEDDE